MSLTAAERERLKAAVSEARRREAGGPARQGKVGTSPFRSLLASLPGLIADAAERGLPVHVVFPEPLTPSAERLLETLGATWEVTSPERRP